MKRTYQERQNFECKNSSQQQISSEHLVPAVDVISQMRRIIPNEGEISADAIISIQECVSKFISFVTAEANRRCLQEMRTSITAEDVLIAMTNLGFYSYIRPLFIYLTRFRQFEGDQHPSLRGEPLVIRRSFQPGGMGNAAAFDRGSNVQGMVAMGGFVRDGHNDGPSGSAEGTTGDA